MKNQLLLLCLVYGLSGGPVHLNPTEPFNLYLEVGFVSGLFVASPFVFYQLWLFMAPGNGRRASALCLPTLVSRDVNPERRLRPLASVQR